MNDDDVKRIEKKLDAIEADVKSLMIFMAVSKANDSKNSKVISTVVSLVVSLLVLGVSKFIGA